MFALLGDITLEAVASPETIDSARGWNFAEHKTVESTPKLQWIGNDLEEITLDFVSHVSFANPALDVAALEAAGDAHRALALVFGNGDHWGYFVIVKLAKSNKQLASDGSIIAIALKLTLKEWDRSIEIDPSAPPLPDSTPPGIIIGALLPGQTVAGVVGADGSVTFPDTSKGVSTVVSNPAAPGAPIAGADPNMVSPSVIVRMDPNVGGVLA